MARNGGLYSPYGCQQSKWEDERAENFGFLRGEAEELACQGGKPWDDDAWVSSSELFFLSLLMICPLQAVMDALLSGF